MTAFLDASAIVAILTNEPEGPALAAEIQAAARTITSPIAIFEATLALARVKGLDILLAQDEIAQFLDTADTEIVPVYPDAGPAALAAHSRYGKGRGHPAQLNFGDCFAYAVAKHYRARLIYKGDDFDHTDVARNP